ncbi:MAG: acyl transferase [Solitalea-like symbiont of Tyrophagus putrescentiae]
MLSKIFKVSEENFLALAKEVFKYQVDNLDVYYDYIKNTFPHLISNYQEIRNLSEIPFMPISAFKKYRIISNHMESQAVFMSSGTAGERSKHYVADLDLYKQSFTKSFKLFYGDISDWHILSLLPSYVEQGNSSLVYMVDNLIREIGDDASGFYLYDHEKLYNSINKLAGTQKKILLIGVSYALLDFVEKYTLQHKIHNLFIMETGGMKGRREEISKEALHEILKQAFKVDQVHSEYGMTELLSQAYSSGGGIFRSPNWMKIIISDFTDPFNSVKDGKTGIVKVIDLANIYSCSFIQTEDIGVKMPGERFKILGRLSSADMRGCNLMLND